MGRAADLAIYYQALLANDGERWDPAVLRAGTGEVLNDFPDSGISFAYLTNGLDAHVLREARRKVGLSARAVATQAS